MIRIDDYVQLPPEFGDDGLYRVTAIDGWSALPEGAGWFDLDDLTPVAAEGETS